MNKNKKRLGKLAMIASAFVLMAALGVAAWAASVLTNPWQAKQTVNTNFAVVANLEVAFTGNGYNWVGTLPEDQIDALYFDERGQLTGKNGTLASPPFDFGEIVLDDLAFALIYAFTIDVDVDMFEDLTYTITYDGDTEFDCVFEITAGKSGSEVINAGDVTDEITVDKIVVTATLTRGAGLSKAGNYEISFTVDIEE